MKMEEGHQEQPDSRRPGSVLLRHGNFVLCAVNLVTVDVVSIRSYSRSSSGEVWGLQRSNSLTLLL